MIATILDEHTVDYFIQSDDLGGLTPALSCMNGIKLFVSDEDYDRTLNLLQRE